MKPRCSLMELQALDLKKKLSYNNGVILVW